jgi:hypothetical protein
MKASTLKALTAAAVQFDKTYDGLWEDEADMQRGEFLDRFPVYSLPALTLQEYAIGQNRGQTFCHWAEPGTDKWARIKGATADKFGIYYGFAGKGSKERYRYTKKYAKDLPPSGAEDKVFPIVHAELLKLVESARDLNFPLVDENNLSQMLKAKVISLYFDDLYLPICSKEKLLVLAEELEIYSDSPSQIQHELLELKQVAPIFMGWSNLKLSDFLLRLASGGSKGLAPAQPTTPPRKPKVPNLNYEPNFEELAKAAREKGEKSERFAHDQEKHRLRSRGQKALIPKIQDRTKKPRYGYDFESFSDGGEPRYIEVKTFTGSRFFLSANELRMAQDEELGSRYFFYLVTYDKHGEPEQCLIYRASDVLGWCDLLPQTFMVKAPNGFHKHVQSDGPERKSK